MALPWHAPRTDSHPLTVSIVPSSPLGRGGRIRLRGPVADRNATPLLGLASLLIVARIPMGFLGLLLLSAAVVVVQGIRPHASWPRSLRALLTWCLVASLLSVAIFHPVLLAGTGNNFIVMVAITLVALGVFNGGRTREACDWIVEGLYIGLALSWLVSMGEVVTGIKMMDIIYPGNNTASLISHNRLFVSAFFPNYNDYCVAMVMLCTLVMARMVFQPRAGTGRTALRLLMLLTSTFLIVHMGSRGALIGLVIAAGIIALLATRTINLRAVPVRLAFLCLVVLVGIAGLVFTSSYVQDHSTATRGTIITNALTLMGEHPVNALLGFGALTAYQAAARDRFGDILMDPHNLLLEMAISYGVPALVMYLVCWLGVLRRGLVRMQQAMTWRSVAALTITALMPVLGVVPSSTLRYHVTWLWLVAAMGYLQAARRQGFTRG